MKDDIISRRFLIEAFKDEFYAMYSDDFNYMIKWFENLPAADSSEFCDQLWKIAYEHGKRDAQPGAEPMTGLYEAGFNDGYKAGKEEAHSRTGKWVYDEERGARGIYAICTACNEMIYQTGGFHYCPNCGARMEETDERT